VQSRNRERLKPLLLYLVRVVEDSSLKAQAASARAARGLKILTHPSHWQGSGWYDEYPCQCTRANAPLEMIIEKELLLTGSYVGSWH